MAKERKVLLITGLFFLLLPSLASAGEADVLKVDVARDGAGYAFSVTLQHNDEGWQHYADKWEVVAPDGQVLATRVLYHPHVNEQPFTRSLSGVSIASTVTSVSVRAHDSIHGYGGKTVKVTLSE